mmetsp:Transcript_4059/g.4729  ORF Transcript_4059/g.4729 Transcript_4059/m.4729 type:complete len:235 (-) Transcript_4059:71-775(-)
MIQRCHPLPFRGPPARRGPVWSRLPLRPISPRTPRTTSQLLLWGEDLWEHIFGCRPRECRVPHRQHQHQPRCEYHQRVCVPNPTPPLPPHCSALPPPIVPRTTHQTPHPAPFPPLPNPPAPAPPITHTTDPHPPVHDDPSPDRACTTCPPPERRPRQRERDIPPVGGSATRWSRSFLPRAHPAIDSDLLPIRTLDRGLLTLDATPCPRCRIRSVHHPPTTGVESRRGRIVCCRE